MTRTRSAPHRSSARRAATAALLNRQKPIDSAAIRSTYASGCTARSTSRSTAGDSRTSQCSQSRADSTCSIASIRATRSGCTPVSCSSDDGWRSRSGEAISLPYPRMTEPGRIDADLAVVGAGAAGLYAALTGARSGATVALVSATPLARTASYWAQGGLAAALAMDDSPDLHREDTERAGRGLVRTSAATVLCREAPRTVGDLERLGVHFDADRHGNLALGLEGGHSRRRVVHAGGSATGRRVVRQLSAVVVETPGITVIEGARAAKLWTREG